MLETGRIIMKKLDIGIKVHGFINRKFADNTYFTNLIADSWRIYVILR
jgi:hypothetical protein